MRLERGLGSARALVLAESPLVDDRIVTRLFEEGGRNPWLNANACVSDPRSLSALRCAYL